MFSLSGSNVYKSKIIYKNLNPVWSEEFNIELSPALLQEKVRRKSIVSFIDIDEKYKRHQKQHHNHHRHHKNKHSDFLSKLVLKIIVYDYDRGFVRDDLIGYSYFNISTLKENV